MFREELQDNETAELGVLSLYTTHTAAAQLLKDLKDTVMRDALAYHGIRSSLCPK